MNYFLSFCLLTSPFLLASAEIPTTEDREMSTFLNQLQGQIQKQAQFVEDLKNQVARKDVINDSSIVFRYENAAAMLTVKRTLYANFVNTPSIQSPLVRKFLLALFQKEMITPGDLAELQALVNQERPKYIVPTASPAQAPTVPLQ